MQMLTVATVALSAAIHARPQELSQAVTCLPGVIIKLPTGWKSIERQVLEESANELIGVVPNARLRREQLVTGFQLESDQLSIKSPKIIVLTNAIGRVSDQTLRELVPSLRKIQTSTDAALAGNALEASAKVSSVTYDDLHHFLRVEAIASVPEAGALHVVSIMFATESGIVTFQFISTAEHHQRYFTLFSKVIEGIEVFRPEYPVPPGDPQARETNKVYWTPKYGRMRWTGNGWVFPNGAAVAHLHR
jgi:hypothetical protein